MSAMVLSWLIAAMLALSGAVKARSGARQGLGILPGVLAELLAGVAFAAMPLAGVGPPVWLTVAAVVLLIASTTHHGLVLRRLRRRREASEGGRLAAYVKYLSEPDEDA